MIGVPSGWEIVTAWFVGCKTPVRIFYHLNYFNMMQFSWWLPDINDHKSYNWIILP